MTTDVDAGPSDRKREKSVGEVAKSAFSSIAEDRQARASLKRASTIEKFNNSWTVARLVSNLRNTADQSLNDSQLIPALWAVGCPRVFSDKDFPKVARAAGISERSWQKLTSTRNRLEAARQIRRITKRLPAVPVADIVEGLYFWGDRRRREWAMGWFDIQEETDA